jgi:hypothetical protein
VIVDEHDFPGEVESAKGLLQPANEKMDAAPFVVNGNYHAQNHDDLKILPRSDKLNSGMRIRAPSVTGCVRLEAACSCWVAAMESANLNHTISLEKPAQAAILQRHELQFGKTGTTRSTTPPRRDAGGFKSKTVRYRSARSPY